jgi:head-tail adaptor
MIGRGGGTQATVNKGQVTLGHTVRIRYSSALASMDETWRLLLGSRVLEISSITNVDYLNEILEITCSEEVV